MSKLNMMTAAALLTLSLSLPVAAADDHAAAAAHGGQYVEIEGHHGAEMVAGPDALTFHLTDDHKPMDLTGAQLKALVQTEAGTSAIALVIEGSTAKGALKDPLPAGAKIVLSGKDRHGHALRARFVKQ